MNSSKSLMQGVILGTPNFSKILLMKLKSHPINPPPHHHHEHNILEKFSQKGLVGPTKSLSSMSRFYPNGFRWDCEISFHLHNELLLMTSRLMVELFFPIKLTDENLYCWKEGLVLKIDFSESYYNHPDLGFSKSYFPKKGFSPRWRLWVDVAYPRLSLF